MKLTKDQQIEALKMLTPEWAIQRSPRIAGGKPWTAHEYVVHMLDTIFEPDCWDFEITGDMRTVELPGSELLLSVPGKLTIRFADGTVAVRSDVGTGSVHRLKDETDLSKTPVENFETGMKDAVTSALKGCARDLGRIFVPMQSDLVANLIRRNVFEAELDHLLPALSGEEMQRRLESNKTKLGRDNGDLTADPENQTDTTASKLGNGHTRPLAPEALRDLLGKKAATHANQTATEKQRGLAASILQLCFAGEPDAEAKRHSVQVYLFGVESLNDVRDALVLAMLDWLKPSKDAGGQWMPDAMAAREARAVLQAQQEQMAGQMQLGPAADDVPF